MKSRIRLPRITQLLAPTKSIEVTGLAVRRTELFTIVLFATMPLSGCPPSPLILK